MMHDSDFLQIQQRLSALEARNGLQNLDRSNRYDKQIIAAEADWDRAIQLRSSSNTAIAAGSALQALTFDSLEKNDEMFFAYTAGDNYLQIKYAGWYEISYGVVITGTGAVTVGIQDNYVPPIGPPPASPIVVSRGYINLGAAGAISGIVSKTFLVQAYGLIEYGRNLSLVITTADNITITGLSTILYIRKLRGV